VAGIVSQPVMAPQRSWEASASRQGAVYSGGYQAASYLAGKDGDGYQNARSENGMRGDGRDATAYQGQSPPFPVDEAQPESTNFDLYAPIPEKPPSGMPELRSAVQASP
jgi:hypothetical protein